MARNLRPVTLFCIFIYIHHFMFYSLFRYGLHSKKRYVKYLSKFISIC